MTTITLWQWHCHSAKSELYQKSYTVTGWQFKVWNITLRHSVGHKPTIRRSAKVSMEYSRVYKGKGYTLLHNGEWPFLYLRVHYPSKEIMCIWPLLYLSPMICLERSVWNTDCGLRTTDCGLGIKHGLGIKGGLRIEYKTRTTYKTQTTDYVYKNSFRKVNLREKKSGLA